MPPPQQKPVTPSLPVERRVAFEIARAVDHVGAQLALVEAGLQRAPVVVVARIAADRRQARRARAPGILPLAARRATSSMYGLSPRFSWITSTVGNGPAPARLHQVAAHRAGGAARRRIGHVARLDARIGERDRLRLRVARQQRLRHREPAGRPRPRAPGTRGGRCGRGSTRRRDRTRAGRSSPGSEPAAPRARGLTARRAIVRT